MKLAIMQPYFFPYLGYFDLLRLADEWVVFDTPQYIRHGWMNRNRILHPVSDWQYIILPLKKHRRKTPINQIEIPSDGAWGDLILRQLAHYRADAPYYDEVIAFLEDCFATQARDLASANIAFFKKTARRLGIERPIHVYSAMNLPLQDQPESPGDWALLISQAMGATEYINRPGGEVFLDEQRFRDCGIRLTIQSYTSMAYGCGSRSFVPDLSIIDVMMWNSPEEIKQYLDTQH
ncbi:MAG: WbqC family protein [Caldilineaceae bacterium]|nr:WbqC family protein [Caldilineaceae bacterium]MBP8108378.1 WbqC family protein [Caldilineaceae bacterium]MBP8123303.1 WbqC family protein [Caldilineaceae bacterium]MBP9073535.1 WbqC family protein [Caldilineaceae bacterium]